MREIRTSGSIAGMGNGALPHGPSYRAHPGLYLLGRWPDTRLCPRPVEANIRAKRAASHVDPTVAKCNGRHSRPLLRELTMLLRSAIAAEMKGTTTSVDQISQPSALGARSLPTTDSRLTRKTGPGDR